MARASPVSSSITDQPASGVFSIDKVEVGGVHFDGEATHDKRQSQYHPAPVFIAQNYAHFAGKSSLVDADFGPDNQVRMRFTIL